MRPQRSTSGQHVGVRQAHSLPFGSLQCTPMTFLIRLQRNDGGQHVAVRQDHSLRVPACIAVTLPLH